jgi:hypothetical protein
MRTVHLCLAIAVLFAFESGASPLSLETDFLRVQVDDLGRIILLADRKSGIDYLAKVQSAPLMRMRVAGEFIDPDAMDWSASNNCVTFHYAKAGATAKVQIESKASHLVFELLSVEPASKAELVLWGPYPTTIGAIVGETVGVVRNQDFALGIQSLNGKTLGGYPNTEDDVMASYGMPATSGLTQAAPEPGETDAYRGDTAKPTSFGSVLQAYCRDRHKVRTIENWAHTHYIAPAYSDGGVVGSRIALFGCPPAAALETIGKIELAEGLPHPMLDGVWGKVSPDATASYLIVDFGEDSIEQALQLTKQAGLKYLYHGGPFRTWGHFELQPKPFPHGWQGMKQCVDRAKELGIRLGVHTLSNFITPNDPYVTPVPDARLAQVGATKLSRDLDGAQTEIAVEEGIWFNQMKNNTLKTVVVGSELIRYGGVSDGPPWRLLDCQRGAWGTKAASHSKGDSIGKLMDHGYRVFLTDAGLSQEVARAIADFCNKTGLMQVSFDGLEGNWSTGMGQYGRTLFTTAWFDRLSPELRGRVINDASNPGHFNWHIYTRMNWGEPWYAGFRESQTQYRLQNQKYYRRNLMPSMLGWFQMGAATSLEDAEWLLARAAGFDAGFCLVTSPETARKNGVGDVILKSIRQWETARLAGAFPENAKPALRDIQQEFHLEPVAENAWELSPVYSLKMSHNKMEQPGMPTTSSASMGNPHASQPLQFILQAAGKTEADSVLLGINGKEALVLPQPLAAGEIIKYAGGAEAIRYEEHWQRLGSMAVDSRRLQIESGKCQVTVSCRFSGGDKPELKCEFRTVGGPQRIKAQRILK